MRNNPLPLLLLLAALAALAALARPAPAAAQDEPRETIVIRTAAGEEHTFHVEIADEQAEILKGLTMRAELPADAGMLFVFPDVAERSFWMRNTYIELDILFLRSDGRISRIHHRAVPGDLSGIPSGGPISRVLEIGGGIAESLGIREGDVVHHPMYFARGDR